jgi:hypothetical protein
MLRPKQTPGAVASNRPTWVQARWGLTTPLHTPGTTIEDAASDRRLLQTGPVETVHKHIDLSDSGATAQDVAHVAV